MIYIDQNQLDQVNYLIEQSIQGNHILFDHDTLRQVFWDAPISSIEPISEDEAYSVEPLIEKLIAQPSLEEKRAYLEQLDRETYFKVVRTYFRIVENNLSENSEVKH